MWKPGDRLSHRYNPDLGPGKIISITGRNLLVYFPESDEALRFAANTDALKPLALAAGSRALHEPSGDRVTIEAEAGEDCYRLSDGREIPIQELWPLPAESSPIDRLARGKIDSHEDFVNRLDGLRLLRLREADGLGSFLGGRIELFPHQLYVASRACGLLPSADSAEDTEAPVRWLLADEVGLGKTVEACLVMNRLIYTGRVSRALVVAPETLTVQWLGELWRKYHQIFVLIDDRRLADVERDHGPGFNPFEVYRRAIISIEQLAADPWLTQQAVEAGIDLLVVDEAHHLKRPEDEPGNPEYQAIAPIAELGRHILLLTATPLEDDAHGFFRLLQLLRPDVFPEEQSFESLLEDRRKLPPCTSATRRDDIGGLPPRHGLSIDIDDAGWAPMHALEKHLRKLEARNAASRERKTRKIRYAMSSAAALRPLIRARDTKIARLIEDASTNDPRMLWLTAQAARWRRQQEKTLVFVSHRESLEYLKESVERRGRVQVGVFHEDLTPERRDIEVAQFRLEDGPALLISTECGGEGRNFEFCKRLVLFDLPWNPTMVEQRIGRLDRIGRVQPTEIIYFRPPRGLGHAVTATYEAIGLFEKPLGGIHRELKAVEAAIEEVALDGAEDPDPETFAPLLDRALLADSRIQEAAFHELHRAPYRQELADPVLACVPEELDELNEDVVLRAAARFGFHLEQQSGRRCWLVEFGSGALIDNLPGVPPGSRFLGTFDRREAVDDEGLEFFAAGHPLVEGVLAELEEGPRGRASLLQVKGETEAFGLLAVYSAPPDFVAVAVDNRGQPRPDLAEFLTERQLAPEKFSARKWTSQPSWRQGVLRMAKALPADIIPVAVAAFHIRPG